ncbi:hypothetical protein [Kitasatospora sp. NPDC050543]|uniref:hypothetical protein n=1 Tax=Kitasatospora sp. NPDC050543 TaxID=3364054 RepID=UPI0037B380FA
MRGTADIPAAGATGPSAPAPAPAEAAPPGSEAAVFAPLERRVLRVRGLSAREERAVRRPAGWPTGRAG